MSHDCIARVSVSLDFVFSLHAMLLNLEVVSSSLPAAEYVGPIGVFAHDFKHAEKLQAAARGYQGRCEVKRMHKSCLVIIAAL